MILLRCPAPLVAETLEELRAGGRQGVERIVFWLGRKDADRGGTIAEIHVPQHEAAEDYFHIPPQGMIAFMSHLRLRRLTLLAQVHSHPGPAFHSPADDRWAVVRHEGGLSIVVPTFAADTTVENFAAAAAVFHLTNQDRWQLVTTDDLPNFLRIT
jgi:hypothetical protein